MFGMTTEEVELLARVRALCESGRAEGIRRADRLSLGDAAAAAGVSRSTVLRWERGERRPTGPAALRYARWLNDRLGVVR